MTDTSTPRPSIVFFGSGPVAATSLRLLRASFTIEAVITKPRPEHHKGVVPVLALCEELSMAVFTPASKNELSALFARQRFHSPVGVVIDYGIIITQDVIDTFPYGIVNSHFSLLPQWRGADPITFAILSGQKQTGVSLMLINDKMDEGPLLAQAPYDLPTDITTPELTEDLIDLSDAMLKEIMPKYLSDQIQPQPQLQASIASSKEPTYSRKLTKNDGVIDWTKSAEQIEREIRAFIEWPKSHATLGNIEIIITKAHSVPGDSVPGAVEVIADMGVLIIYTGSGYLCIDTLKPAGKKEMTASEFIRGYGSRIGTEAS
jgi:methionyl-tRNA formyltransferase